MAKYTTEVRSICEMAYYSKHGEKSTIDNHIKAGADFIFDFDYDIHDPAYKKVLESKILRHYYQREIGMETYMSWKNHLQSKLDIIMPYYARLYASELLKFDPIADMDITETYKKTAEVEEKAKSVTDDKNTSKTDSLSDVKRVDSTTGTTRGEAVQTDNTKAVARTETNANDTRTDNLTEDSTSLTNENQNARRLRSDTPQHNYANVDYATELNDDTQTNVVSVSGGTKNTGTQRNQRTGTDTTTTDNTGTTKNESDETQKLDATSDVLGNEITDVSAKYDGKKEDEKQANTTEEYILHRVGHNTNAGDLLSKYRSALLQIDRDIINELGDLFMVVY